MKSILDPTFRYVPSASTDLRKTFDRIRRDRRTSAAELAHNVAGPSQDIRLAVATKAAQQR